MGPAGWGGQHGNNEKRGFQGRAGLEGLVGQVRQGPRQAAGGQSTGQGTQTRRRVKLGPGNLEGGLGAPRQQGRPRERTAGVRVG